MKTVGWTNASRRNLAACLSLAVIGGCAAAEDAGDATEARTSGLMVPTDPNAILGFESVGSWTACGEAISASTNRTQGAAALAVRNPSNEMDLVSAPVASTASALRGIGDEGASLSLDVLVPTTIGNPRNAGSVQLFIDAPSRGLRHVNVGSASLRQARLGVFNTVKFAVPEAVRRRLGGATFRDLTFDLKLHAPGRSSGTYRFDNLRVHSASTPPAGANQSVDLVAQRGYSPATNAPAEAHFAVGGVQVPASFHLKLGRAGSGSARLELGYGSAPSVTCTYGAGSDAVTFALTSCTGGVQAGDILSADFARLTIVGGDAAAGPTKIRAQLALNPAGDDLGADVIPPMPTYWGDAPDEADAIVTSYFNAVSAHPVEGNQWVRTPVPEFARRHGDGAARDNLLGVPPPPDDPPFDQEGHLNPGGAWDAYWRLQGHLTAVNSAGRDTTEFVADASAHAVVWGRDVDVARIHTEIHTDSGVVDPYGFRSPSASGNLGLYLFGVQMPGGGTASPSTGFRFTATSDQTFTLPAIRIWVFAIRFGVNAQLGVESNGSLSAGGFGVDLVPTARVGAHIEGGVDVGVLSGGVAANIQLLSFQMPLAASGFWHISTDPAVCSASIRLNLDGRLHLTSLGGQVDLVASVNLLFYKRTWSWPLFHWEPLVDLGTVTLFHFDELMPVSPLPRALCIVPLNVSIASPSGGSVSAGVPTVLSGSAERPGTATSDSPLMVPSPVDCSALTWTSSSPTDVGFPATGCHPSVTFGAPGPRTLTLNARDAYGETGSASTTFTVATPPAVATPYITAPTGTIEWVGATYPTLHFAGGYVGGTGTVTLTWTATPDSGTPITIGTGPSIDWVPSRNATYTITLTATDDAAPGATTSPPLRVIITRLG